MAQQFYSPLQLNSTLTVGVDDTGHDVKFFGATSGRYMLWDESQDRLEFTDDVKAVFGTNADLVIYHDGSNSYITQQDGKSGNLIISQNTDDADIIFKSDDGSGGVAEYFRVDGSLAEIIFSRGTRHMDSKKATFGSGQDLQIYHDGSHSYMDNGTGNLYIRNLADDADVIFRTDDGAGDNAEYLKLKGSTRTIEVSAPTNFGVDDTGHDVFFYGATSGKYLKWDESADCLFFPDDTSVKFGNGNDARIYISSDNLHIQQDTADTDIKFLADNGSGQATVYLTLDGSHTETVFSQNARFADNAVAKFGVSSDLQIYHNASNSYIYQVGTGNLHIATATDDGDIIFSSDDGSGGVAEYFRVDGGSSQIEVSKSMRFADGIRARFGAAADIDIYHDGSNSYIKNATGDLYIQQNADDKDIVFQSDDGSGGVTAYLTLDGSTKRNVIHQHTNTLDNIALFTGTGQDFGIFHDGSHTYLTNDSVTGSNLYIRQATNDADIIFQCDDGSGGLETYFYLDGSLSSGNPYTTFPDYSHLTFGTGSDLTIVHDSNNSYINNITGDLYITNGADDKDIIFRSDDGSGGMETYFFLDGSTGQTRFPDNKLLSLGTGGDLDIYHDGSNSFIQNTTGNLTIRNDVDDGDIIFRCDDGSGGVETYFFLDGSSGGGAPFTVFPDSSYAVFGAGHDLRIYHDGSDSYINNMTGDLYIVNGADDKDIIFRSDDGSGGVATYLTLDGSGLYSEFGTRVYIPEYIAHSGDADSLFGFSGADTFIINTAGTTALTVDSSQNATFAGAVTISGVNNTYNFKALATDTDSWFGVYEDDNNSANIILTRSDGAEMFKILGHTGAATFAGNITFGDGHTIGDDGDDNLVITGSASENIIIDSADGIILDAGGGDVILKDDGTEFGRLARSGSHLEIIQNTNDGDIVFKSDDGSGGVETYFFLDGSANGSDPLTIFPDNSYLAIGSGTDLYFNHNGTNSFIQNATGNLIINQRTNDGDLILQCDDGSGGETAYLTLDGGLGFTTIQKHVRWEDGIIARFGNSDDGSLYHSGSHFYMSNSTGNIFIQNNTDNGDIIFQSDDGAGGVATYFTLDGSAATHDGSATTALYTLFPDKSVLGLGSRAEGDMRLYHDGSNSYIYNYTGNLEVINHTDDGDIIFKSDDGSGGLNTYLTIDGGADRTIFSRSSRHNDGVIAAFGTSEDLQVYHDGSHSYLENGTGSLFIRNNTNDTDIIFQSDSGNGGIATYFSLDGSAASHNGSATTALYTNWPDNSIVSLGDGHDLQISHSGSNSQITNLVGNLTIEQNTDDGDIIFKSDDGSGGVTEYFRIDGGSVRSEFSKAVRVIDNISLEIGTGADLQFSHNGTNSSIVNYGGDLNITNTVDDGDITFNSDDGSGGNAEYFRLDGSAGYTVVSKDINFSDNTKALFGASHDLQIYHNGSNDRGYIYNGTGDLYIENDATDGDIKFFSDDGSGGTTEYFRLDGGDVKIDFTQNVRHGDNVMTNWGSSNDLQIYHDGTDSYVSNTQNSGDLIIENGGNNKDVIFRCDDGSGGLETYFFLDGSASSGNPITIFPDNSYLQFGTSMDLGIAHDGSNSNFTNVTGNLNFINYADDKDIVFQSDDQSGGVAEYFRLAGNAGITYFSRNLQLADNVQAHFGSGQDLKLYHDGSNSYITESGTGNLFIQGSNHIYFRSADTAEYYAQFNDDGACKLYYDNSVKFETTSAGITVAGNIVLSDDGTIGSASDTDAISIDDSGVVTFSSRIIANVREFEVASGTDGDGKGDVVYFGSTTSMTAGAIYHYKSNGTWELVDADSAATCDGLLAVALGAASNTNGMLLRGMVTIANDPGAVGDVLYASTTAGQATATAPSGSGDIVRVIGYCVHATNGNIWFNPDGTFVEVA